MLRRLMMVTLATLLITAGLSVPQWISTVTGAVANASGTGTGGAFVPVQGRLVDTRSAVGGFTGPMVANTAQSFQVLGQAGIPATGVTAVVVNVTALNGTTSANVINVQPDGASPGGAGFLVQNPGETVSNTGIVEVAANGKIQVVSQQAIHILIDVQGYFATGNGTPAPGGFVPVTQQTIFNQAAITVGTTTDVQVTGTAGIPNTATAVFANLTLVNNQTGAIDNYVVAYPTATTAPGTSLNYSVGTTSIGTAIDLNAQGKLSITVANNAGATAVDLFVDVYGYFDGQPSNAAYNTQQSRLYDSRVTTGALAGGDWRQVVVGGIGGMPTTTADLAAFAMNVTTSSSTGSGYLTVWTPGQSEPAVSSIAYGPGVSSNLIVVKPGTSTAPAPDMIYIRNNGTNPVDFIVDSEGWFTNSNALPAAVGANPATSGNRSSASLLIRSLTDRVQAGVNPTNGNLLVTQSLLSLSGIGTSVGIGVRYNAINDTRPTLNMGLFESELFRNPDNSITYTDGTGTAYNFTPKTGAVGQYNIPNDINAHLTRTVSGSPNTAISNGATYELVFHPSQVKNVYVSDGANLKLVRTQDVTGTNRIEYTYSSGKMTSIKDTQGRVVNLGYSSSPNPTQPTTIVDTSLSRTVTLEYAGPSGALSKVTDATGAVTNWAYGSNGKVSSVTNAGTGSRADFNYGTGNRIADETFGANNTAVSGKWSFNYNTPTTTVVTDPNSPARTNTYSFNATGQVIGTTDARGLNGTSAFSTHGNLTSMLAPGITDATTISYDTVNTSTYNITGVKAPGGRSSTITYGTAFVGNGATSDYRPTSVKDAQDNTSDLTTNSFGQTVTQIIGKAGGTGTAAGGTISYKYTGSNVAGTSATCGGRPAAGSNPAEAGQLCQKTDAKGNVTSYTYDTTGNLATMTPPSPLGAHTYTFDAAGRKTAETDGRGNTAYYCYDKNDRLLQKSYTSSNCAVTSGNTFVYDTAGNTTSRTDASGTTTYTWDAQMRPTVKDAPGTLNDSTATYDRVGNILTLMDGGTGAANTTTYRYDDANNLIAVAEPTGSCPTTPTIPNSTKCTVITMKSDRELPDTMKYPNGVTSTYSYDKDARMTGLLTTNAAGTTTLVNRTYTWSVGAADKGVLQSVSDGLTGAATSYSYDGLNQLTAAQTMTGATVTAGWAWTYDLNGNRTQQNTSGTIINYGYNTADELCWSGTGTSGTCTPPTGATTYAYDGNGNLTTGSYTYNTEDQFTATSSSTYTYAGTTNNERLTWVQGSTTNTFTNSLINQVTGQTAGSATTRYIRNPKTGDLIARQTSAGSMYYTLDYNKSVILMTDSTQAAVATYDYDPYGQVLNGSGNGTGTAATGNPFRYTSGYQTSPNALIKMGARYYNPTTGRFTQPDPSGREANNYAYAGNNPTTYNDPSGLFSVGDALTAASDLIGVGSLALGPVGAAIGGVVSTGLGIAGDIANGASDEEVLAGGLVDIAGAAVSGVGAALDVAEGVAQGVDAAYTAVGVCMDYC